jgi:hypothetical protein
MRRSLLILALLTAGCDRQPEKAKTNPAPNPVAIPQLDGPQSKIPAVVPMPKDQAELDRMILAGYTPHGNHLHSPGVNECPLAKGNEAVM